MNKFINFLDNYFFEIVLFLLFSIAIYNGCCNVAILSDSAWYILNLIQNNPTIDHTRFFVSFLLSVPIFFINLLNINNVSFINTISIFYGAWFYILPLIPILLLNYFLPKQQKNYLAFALISYLLSMIFSSYFIASEIYITTSLYWFISLSVLLLDFNKMSVFKKIILLIFCITTIFSYQIFFIYSLILMSLIIISKKKNAFTYIIFLLILISAITTFNFTINANDTNSSKFLSNLYQTSINLNYIQYIIITCVILTIINYKRKYINISFLIILFILNFLFVLNNFDILLNAHDSRTLTPVFTLIVSSFLILLYLFKKNINFRIVKCIVAILLLVYSINTFIINNKLQVKFNTCIDILKNEKETIIPINSFIEQSTIKKIAITDVFVLPRQLILIQLLYSNNKEISKIVYNSNFDKNSNFNSMHIEFIKSLERFGIKYSEKLLKEIETL